MSNILVQFLSYAQFSLYTQLIEKTFRTHSARLAYLLKLIENATVGSQYKYVLGLLKNVQLLFCTPMFSLIILTMAFKDIAKINIFFF